MVVGVMEREPERDREQARRLRRQFGLPVSAPRTITRELGEHGIGRVQSPRRMRRSCTVRRGGQTARPARHKGSLARPPRPRAPSAAGTYRNSRARVDETPDQPGAGDAIDLGTLARDPAGWMVDGRWYRQRSVLCDRRPAAAVHASMPPFEKMRVQARFTQHGAGVLAYLVAMHAVHGGCRGAGAGT